MTDPSFDPIFTYLREHSPRYSLPALREQLVQSGYDPARVDEAIAVYRSENPPAARPHVFLKALLVVGVNAVLTLGMIRAQSLKGDAASMLSSLYLLLAGAELFGGILACFPARSRSWGLALLLGFAISIALGILALGGFCLYILSKA